MRIIILFSALALIAGLNACSKTDETLVEPPHPQLDQRTLSLPTISVNNGILVFSDSADVMQAILYLQQEWDYHNDTFNANYTSYTDDQLDSIANALGFEEDQPLIDFEDNLSFSSLRDSIETEMDGWLDNTVLNDATNPENFYIVDPFLRTLLNNRCEIIVDSSIWTFHEDGSATEVFDLNFDVLDSVRNETFDPENSPNGRLEPRDNHNGQLDCCNHVSSIDSTAYNSAETKRIECYLELRSWPWTGSIVGKTIALRQKSNGKWERYRSEISVRIYGEAEYDLGGYCNGDPHTFDKSKSKKRRKVVERFHPWRYLFIRAEKVYSDHTGAAIPYDVTLELPCTD